METPKLKRVVCKADQDLVFRVSRDEVYVKGPDWDLLKADLRTFVKTLPPLHSWTIGVPMKGRHSRVGFVVVPKGSGEGIPSSVKVSDGSTIPVYIDDIREGRSMRVKQYM